MLINTTYCVVTSVQFSTVASRDDYGRSSARPDTTWLIDENALYILEDEHVAENYAEHLSQ